MVPKISFGPPIVAAARKEFPDTIFDVKLGIIEPEHRIADFAKAGADIISVRTPLGNGSAASLCAGVHATHTRTITPAHPSASTHTHTHTHTHESTGAPGVHAAAGRGDQQDPRRRLRRRRCSQPRHECERRRTRARLLFIGCCDAGKSRLWRSSLLAFSPLSLSPSVPLNPPPGSQPLFLFLAVLVAAVLALTLSACCHPSPAHRAKIRGHRKGKNQNPSRDETRSPHLGDPHLGRVAARVHAHSTRVCLLCVRAVGQWVGAFSPNFVIFSFQCFNPCLLLAGGRRGKHQERSRAGCGRCVVGSEGKELMAGRFLFSLHMAGSGWSLFFLHSWFVCLTRQPLNQVRMFWWRAAACFQPRTSVRPSTRYVAREPHRARAPFDSAPAACRSLTGDFISRKWAKLRCWQQRLSRVHLESATGPGLPSPCGESPLAAAARRGERIQA